MRKNKALGGDVWVSGKIMVPLRNFVTGSHCQMAGSPFQRYVLNFLRHFKIYVLGKIGAENSWQQEENDFCQKARYRC